MEKDEKIFSKEAFFKDVESLKNMGEDNAVEVVRGYHKMLTHRLSDCMQDVQKISNLSPAVIPLTHTAVIIAERDFTSENDGKDVNALCVVGGQEEVAELLSCMLNQLNDDKVFDIVAKKRGYVKA